MSGTTATAFTCSRDLRIVSASLESTWRECLEDVEHDFYHSAPYHLFSQQQGEGQAFLAVYREGQQRLLWPYLLRTIEGQEAAGLHDVTSVYGYPGPLSLGWKKDPAFLTRGYQALMELWRSQGVVSAFTRLHPMLENHHLLSVDRALQRQGQTISIDLSYGYDQAAAGYRKTLRYDLNLARQSELVAESDDGLRHLRSFAALYLQTMRRNRASPYYYFDLDYFHDLFRFMGNCCHLLVALWKQRIVAGCLLVEWNSVLHYHLAAMDKEYLGLNPAKLLLDEAARWASLRGLRALHLGGGRRGRRDGLFRFKTGFSHRLHDFYVWKSVIQPELYRALCEVRRQDLERGADRGQSDHFPAYRREASPVRL